MKRVGATVYSQRNQRVRAHFSAAQFIPVWENHLGPFCRVRPTKYPSLAGTAINSGLSTPLVAATRRASASVAPSATIRCVSG